MPWLDIVPAAAPNVTPAEVVAALPPLVIPEIVVVPFAPLSLTLIAPTRAPNALANFEFAVTINASIKTCLVLTSISLITASMVSKSGS